MIEGIYRYVRFHDVPRWERCGWWVVSDLPGPHAAYSVLMKAPCCWRDE